MQHPALRPTCFFTLSDSHCSFWIILFSSAISLWLFLRSSQNLPRLLWSSSSWRGGDDGVNAPESSLPGAAGTPGLRDTPRGHLSPDKVPDPGGTRAPALWEGDGVVCAEETSEPTP